MQFNAFVNVVLVYGDIVAIALLRFVAFIIIIVKTAFQPLIYA